jgi:hypothetical protein
MNKTVVICGSHSATRENAPWGDKSKDIWSLNEAPNALVIDDVKANRYGLNKQDVDKLRHGETLEAKGKSLTLHDIAYYWVRRWDAMFQIHNKAVYQNPANQNDPKHWEWLQQEHGRPIYMQEVDPDVPDSLKYPLDEICEKYLGNIKMVKDGKEYDFRYFTSTFPYALALAIHLGYETIEIYGVELSNGTEYIYQRNCFTGWMMLASQHAKIKMHCGWSMYDDPMYGYEGDRIALELEFFKTDVKELKTKFEKMNRIHPQTKKEHDLLVDNKQIDEVPKKAIERENFYAELGILSGKLAEAERYIAKHEVIEAKTGMSANLPRDEFELCAGRANEDFVKKNKILGNANGKAEYAWGVWKMEVAQNSKWVREAAKNLKEFLDIEMRAAFEAGQRHGVYEYNVRCMQEYDKILRAAGGQKAIGAFDGQ